MRSDSWTRRPTFTSCAIFLSIFRDNLPYGVALETGWDSQCQLIRSCVNIKSSPKNSFRVRPIISPLQQGWALTVTPYSLATEGLKLYTDVIDEPNYYHLSGFPARIASSSNNKCEYVAFFWSSFGGGKRA